MSWKSVLNALLCVFLAALSVVLPAAAQEAQAIVTPSRIAAIDEANAIVLRGNTHPLAQARFDQGAAADSFPMQRMFLVLKRSPAQETALHALLDQQQDSSSPNYHHWLTPQQFGQQFGPSDGDILTITNWLQSHGFSVAGVSNGRTVIEFSGTAGQIRQAFRTEMHRYAVNGQNYWANSSDPQIPAALAPVVAGINTLYNFPRHAMHEITGVFERSRATGAITPAPGTQLTFPNPCSPTAQPFCNFALGPADFAKIYNVPNATLVPAATTQYNGNNQTIVIVGESDIHTSDIAAFRTLFGLPAANLNVIVSGPDPGFDPGGTETEADLDLEWAGAVAPNAAIDYVVAQPTETSLGVDLAAQYAVDNNLGSVLSESYGICELFMGAADNLFYSQLWQQAAAQGITVTVATGDAGSAVCDQNVGTQGPAKYGLSVNGFASTPYNIAVGGTDFNDLKLFSQFWNTVPSDTPTQPSALGYIPEMTWNDTCTNQELFGFFGVTNAEDSCNNLTEKSDGLVNIAGGSGGQSNCTASDGQHPSSCSGGYPKPSWQVPLTPADATRDIPDVSLFASNGFNGSFYIVCEADLPGRPQGTNCDPFATSSTFIGVGGTSASTPAFAGIMALIDQATASRQGNANYILYKLAAQSGASCPSAPSPASICIFYDIPAGATPATTSTIAMPCVPGTPDDPRQQPASLCSVKVSSHTVGVLSGYSAASGYDLATGLGSVNAASLIAAWKTFASNLTPSSTTLTLTAATALTSLTHGESVQAVVNVTGSGGTPTGTVSLIAQTGANTQQGIASAPLVNGSATFSTASLPGDPTAGTSYTVFAQYSGDAVFKSSNSGPQSLSVSPEASSTTLSVIDYSPSTGQITGNASTASYGSRYFLRSDVTNSSGTNCLNLSTGLQVYGCPNGTVTLSADGSPLPGATSVVTLNSQGYAEIQAPQLIGGSHSLGATYSGDNSYNASSTTATVTITPAPTTTSFAYPAPSKTFTIGSPIGIEVQTSSYSFGVAPTGTFTIFDGTQTIGTAKGYSTVYPGQVLLTGTSVTASLAGPSGPHSLSVQYTGDSNYAASSASITVNAVYPTTLTVAANPTSIIYGTNATVTVTATLSTGLTASNPALKPTGMLSLYSGSGPITGAISTTVGPDSKGNWMIQSTVTISPQQNNQVNVTYAGDANYASAQGSLTVPVIVPDFSVTGPSQNLVVTAGQTGSTTLTLTPLTSYTSTVTLTCTPYFQPSNSIPGATCTFSPPSVTLANGAPATVTLSLATLPPSTTLTALSPPDGLHRILPLGSDGNAWPSVGALAFIAAFLLWIFRQPGRFPRAAAILAATAIFCFVIGCGGGGGTNSTGGGANGGGNGGGGTSGPTPTTTTFSTTASKIAPGSSATLAANVSSAHPLTGWVLFEDATSPNVIGSSSNFVNNAVQVQMTAQGSIFPGTHVVTAQYQGDPNNKPSTSGPLNIVVTGTTSLEVVAQTGPSNHIINIGVTIQ